MITTMSILEGHGKRLRSGFSKKYFNNFNEKHAVEKIEENMKNRTCYQSSQMPAVLDSNLVINSIAKKYKTAAQIILQHQVHRGHVICHKSLTKSLTEEILNIFDFEPTNEDIDLIEFLA